MLQQSAVETHQQSARNPMKGGKLCPFTSLYIYLVALRRDGMCIRSNSSAMLCIGSATSCRTFRDTPNPRFVQSPGHQHSLRPFVLQLSERWHKAPKGERAVRSAPSLVSCVCGVMRVKAFVSVFLNPISNSVRPILSRPVDFYTQCKCSV